MKIHFIAIGGSAMHELAIALKEKGHEVTGSDDEVFEPSKSRLKEHGLLPEKVGWDQERMTSEIDVVILGMHARQNNSELKKALELGLKVKSYPEFLFEETRNKKRIVIGGSHGKTTITSMVLHVLRETGFDADYMVGARLEGFEKMVKLTRKAPIAVFEGDEYLSSPIDRRPKFHWYRPHLALLSGIAWDHINVFPTWENYLEQFQLFVGLIQEGGGLVYYQGDPEVAKIAESQKERLDLFSYDTPSHYTHQGTTYLETSEGELPLPIFGDHNLQNLEGARLICQQIGVEKTAFYQAIKTFKGASKRLERIAEEGSTTVFKDYAHSPSKLKATTDALKKQYPERKLVACMELHTFSSLNAEFLKEYEGGMDAADVAMIYFDPQAIQHKKLPPLQQEQVKKAFGRQDLLVYEDAAELVRDIVGMDWEQPANLLMMTSGKFGGIDMEELGRKIINN